MLQPRIHIVLCSSTDGYTEPEWLSKGRIYWNLNRISTLPDPAHMFCAAVLAREDGSPPCSTAIIWQCQAAILTENSRTVLSRV